MNRQEYLKQERERVERNSIRASKGAIRVERGMKGEYHVFGILSTGRVIHEVAETEGDAVRIAETYRRGE